MPSVYHGSKALFAKPDFRYITDQSSYGTNEYGFGFYAASFYGAAYEQSYSEGSQCVIYEMDIPDKRYDENWLKSDQPVGQDIIDRTAAVFDDRNQPILAQSIRHMDAEMTGGEFHAHLRYNISGLSPSDVSKLLVDADVDGYCEGDYYVFFDQDTTPELFIHSAYNIDNSTAIAAHEILKMQENHFPEYDEFSDFDFMSEEAKKGYHELLKLNDPKLAETYVGLIQETQTQRGLFGLRDSLGHAVQRSVTINPGNNEHAYSGTTIFNAADICNDYITPEGFDEKFNAFIEKLSENPVVRVYAANRPKQDIRPVVRQNVAHTL